MLASRALLFSRVAVGGASSFVQRPPMLSTRPSFNLTEARVLQSETFCFEARGALLTREIQFDVPIFDEQEPGETLQFGSVLKKRRKKMNKHKAQKRRWKQRFLRRKLGKL
jgi:Mitochondrial mRNA-processing protein COX24, C-terminal